MDIYRRDGEAPWGNVGRESEVIACAQCRYFIVSGIREAQLMERPTEDAA